MTASVSHPSGPARLTCFFVVFPLLYRGLERTRATDMQVDALPSPAARPWEGHMVSTTGGATAVRLLTASLILGATAGVLVLVPASSHAQGLAGTLVGTVTDAH